MSKHLAKHAAGKKTSKSDAVVERSYYEPYEPADYDLSEPGDYDLSEMNGYEPAGQNAYAAEPQYPDSEEMDYESARTGKKGNKLKVAIILIVGIIIIAALLVLLFLGLKFNKMNRPDPLSEAQKDANQLKLEQALEEEDADPDAAVVSEDEVTSIQDQIQAQLAASGGSLISSKDVVNILLIGTDARDMDELARSDVMMLASLNKKTHQIVLTSFMRDIYTHIPGRGYNRLNAAYAIGGGDYLIETLEADFGIDIDNYVAVNFYIFADVIDTIGGIDLELTDAEVDFINGQAYDGEQAQLGVGTGSIYLEYSEDGWYHLNGTQALAHCRNRSSAGSDFDRTLRQRTVINTMIEKAASASLTKLNDLADTLLPALTTNLSMGDCLSLLYDSSKYLKYEVVSLRVPYDNNYSGAMINGMSVLTIDFAQTSQFLQEVIYGDGSAAAATADEQDNVPTPIDETAPASVKVTPNVSGKGKAPLSTANDTASIVKDPAPVPADAADAETAEDAEASPGE